MSDYTPGPWVHIPNEKFRPGAVLVWTAKGPGHGAICELSGPNGYTETMARHEANARLIAAAPDLLAAAEGVIADVIVTKDNGDRRCIVCMAYFDADAREPQAHVTYCPILTLTAAIKKAKGQ